MQVFIYRNGHTGQILYFDHQLTENELDEEGHLILLGYTEQTMTTVGADVLSGLEGV